MLEYLFGSKTRMKLMRLFFREPEKIFYVRELTRLLETQINAIRRELELLYKAGLIEPLARVPGERDEPGPVKKYYRLNRGSLLYPELQALLLKAKMLGEQAFIDELKNRGGDMKLFLLSGYFTNDDRAPTDILMVGDVKEKAVMRLVGDYEKEHGHTLRYTFLTEQEFFDRRHVMDKFLFALFEAKNIKVVNALGI